MSGSLSPLANAPPQTVNEVWWTTRITPHRGWLDWRLGQLWRYRDLVAMFVWRDFKSLYAQTILGPAWHVVQPLLTTLMFTVIFNRVARLPTDGVPPFLFYLAGTIIWSYFALTLANTASTFVRHSAILGKVYFHRLVIPVSVAISNLVTFGIQLGLFLIILFVSWLNGMEMRFTAWFWCTPLFLLMAAGFALGCGLIVSALTTRYRDLANLLTFGVQLFMFATPVIYPASAVSPDNRWILYLNPLTPIIEGFRRGALGTGSVEVHQVLASAGVIAAILLLGLMLFSHIERSFMDTV